MEAGTGKEVEVAGPIQRLWGLPWMLLGTRLYANAFYLWANTVVTSASTFIFWIVVARLYDVEDVGLAAAAVAGLTLLAAVSNLGLGLGLIRFLPEAGERSASLLNASFMLGAFAATLATIIFLLGLPLWSPSLAFVREQPLRSVLYTLFAVCVTLWMIQTHAFVALRRAEFALLGNLAGSISRLVLLAALAAFLAPFSIVGAWASAPVLSVAAVYLWLLRRAHPTYRPVASLRNWPRLDVLWYSFGNHISMILLMAPGFLLPLLVVHRLGGETNAYFYMAWTLSMVVVTASMSLSLSLFSEGSHERDGLQGDLWRALGAALVVSALALILLLAAGDKLLLAFGSGYSREGANLLRLLALASLPACVTNLYLGVERVRKGMRRLLLMSLMIAGITLAGSYVLLDPVGIEGVGIAWLAAQCVGAAMATGQYFVERRRLIGNPQIEEAGR